MKDIDEKVGKEVDLLWEYIHLLTDRISGLELRLQEVENRKD